MPASQPRSIWCRTSRSGYALYSNKRGGRNSIVGTAQQPPYGVEAEPAPLQKPHMTRALARVGRSGLEFALPDRARRLDFTFLKMFLRAADCRFRDAFLAQFVGNALRAEPAPPRRQHLLDDTRFRQPPAALEIVEQFGYFSGIFSERLEFRGELAPRIFAAGERR